MKSIEMVKSYFKLNERNGYDIIYIYVLYGT